MGHTPSIHMLGYYGMTAGSAESRRTGSSVDTAVEQPVTFAGPVEETAPGTAARKPGELDLAGGHFRREERGPPLARPNRAFGHVRSSLGYGGRFFPVFADNTLPSISVHPGMGEDRSAGDVDAILCLSEEALNVSERYDPYGG